MINLQKLVRIGLVLAGLVVLTILIWQGVTSHGNPDPLTRHLDRTAVILDTAVLVLREGLEAILVLAAITASFMGSQAALRKPVAAGAGAGMVASVITWFVAIAIIAAVNAPALDIQAATGLLAIVVLLVVMNWFFHKIYWTGWISHHNRRRRDLVTGAHEGKSSLLLGLALLGFSAVYREGFEIVLFLQSLRLQAGSSIVLQGVALGLAFTLVVGILTFVAHHRLPYKKMLVFTGIMLGFVLVVMTGESVQEMQQAGWLSTTPVGLPIPDWMGLWFAIFPTLESLTAQALAAIVVIGSYLVAQDVRVRRPRSRGEEPARRPDQAPAL